MKKEYVKPTMEIVEVQLSDCIAGSGVIVEGDSTLGHYEVEGTWTMEDSSIGSF